MQSSTTTVITCRKNPSSLLFDDITANEVVSPLVVHLWPDFSSFRKWSWWRALSSANSWFRNRFWCQSFTVSPGQWQFRRESPFVLASRSLTVPQSVLSCSAFFMDPGTMLLLSPFPFLSHPLSEGGAHATHVSVAVLHLLVRSSTGRCRPCHCFTCSSPHFFPDSEDRIEKEESAGGLIIVIYSSSVFWESKRTKKAKSRWMPTTKWACHSIQLLCRLTRHGLSSRVATRK